MRTLNTTLTLLLAATTVVACDPDTVDGPEVDALADGGADTPVDVDLPLSVAEELDSLQAQSRDNGAVTDVVTEDGAYVAFYVDEDGATAIFEWAPDGVESPLADLDVDTPAEVYEILSDGESAPEELLRALPLIASAQDPQAPAPAGELLDLSLEPEVDGIVSAGCSRTKSNTFYDTYRPGAYSTEKYTNNMGAGVNGPEARRRKLAQGFQQRSGYDTWTPVYAYGGLSGYLRVSAAACQGTVRLNIYKCRGVANTTKQCGNGLGTEKSEHHYTMSSGYGTWIYLENSFDVLSGSVDWVGSNDLYGWSYTNTEYYTGEINNCYY